MKTVIPRRVFLKGVGLALAAAAVPGGTELINVSSGWAGISRNFKPHAFLEIAPDETITVWVGQTELGQGTHTGIAMILADELGADWKKVTSRMALPAKEFLDPNYRMQFTGGSTSIRHRWDLFRKTAAAAREMLIKAAALELGVKADQCRAEAGQVVYSDGRSLSFGRLSMKAAGLKAPQNPPLKSYKDYRIMGAPINRLDIPEKVQGKAVFGIDVKVPGMCIAVVARPPRYGARPSSFDEKAARALPGVLEVISLDDKVAVCAETTYAALQGRDALNIQWTPAAHPDLNDDFLKKTFQEQMAKPGAAAEDHGDARAAIGGAAKTIEASYSLPYLAHATLEPMNCTAHVEKDRCRIWAPTQGQTSVLNTASGITGLPQDKIEVMTTFCGGGFGRRGEMSVVEDAVILSKNMNRPVKAIWSREDDFQNDFYRPGSLTSIKGGLDKEGNLVAWVHKIASPSIMSRVFPDYVKNGVDMSSLEGAAHMIYNLPNRFVEYVLMDLPIPVGFWRSVGYTINAFTVESFMDELAVAAGKDPVEFRLGLLKKNSRPRRILEFLAEKSGWGGTVPKGRGRGVAVCTSFGSSVAHTAEVSVDEKSGSVTVHKITGAIDCGPAVYPDAIKAQFEGAAIMALSVAFKERMNFDAGGVSTLNYDDYPLLSMTEIPEIEVHIMETQNKIGGVGEPGFPTVAPATANAIFNATGIRLRNLPFETEKLKKA